MFGSLKRLWKLRFGSPRLDVGELADELASLSEALPDIIRDLADVHTAIQRIERKQLRWIELLNLQAAMKETPTNGPVTDTTPPGPTTRLTPGQIVS